MTFNIPITIDESLTGFVFGVFFTLFGIHFQEEKRPWFLRVLTYVTLVTTWAAVDIILEMLS